MILSMTGYGCANSAIPLDNLPNQNIPTIAELHVELRSVNARFLDFYFRLPDECRSLEPSLRKLLTRYIARGKIECRIQIKYPSGAQHKTIVDTTILEKTKQLVQQIIDYFPQAAPFSISDILLLPGILQEPKISQTELEKILLSCTENALQQLNLARAQEGSALAQLLLEKTNAMFDIIAQIRPLLPELLALQQKKLTEKLHQILHMDLNIIPDQGSILEHVRQELTTYSLKIDIDEELSRLETHLQTTQTILKHGPTPTGKRLDFIMQELNREANTLASKAASVEIANAAIALKLLIEQMREQVQNLE